MRIILFLLICFSLASCSLKEICDKNFPPIPWETTKTDTVDRFVHDTLYVPYQDVSFDTTSPCPPSVNYRKEITSGRLTGIVDISEGRLRFTCKEDSLKMVIKKKERHIRTLQSRVDVPPPKTIAAPIPWYYDFYKWGFWTLLLIIALLLYMLYRLLKTKITP